MEVARFTLAQVTAIMSRHYARSLKEGPNPERVLGWFVDRVVEDLKKESNNAVEKGLEPQGHQPEHQD